MKKSMFVAALMTAVMLLAAGCTQDEPEVTPSPSPDAVITTPGTTAPGAAASPDTAATPDVAASPDPAVSASPGLGERIEDFVEGAAVDAEKLPTEITEAIKQQFPVATIKTVSYATYEDQQTYKVVVENTEDNTSEEVYVTSGGKILPANAMGGAGGAGSAATGTGGVTPSASPEADRAS